MPDNSMTGFAFLPLTGTSPKERIRSPSVQLPQSAQSPLNSTSSPPGFIMGGPTSGLGITSSATTAPQSAISLLNVNNSSSPSSAGLAEPSDPVLSTATVTTTPPPSQVSSTRPSPSSALRGSSPLGGHTHIPLRRDLESSPRSVSARTASLTGLKAPGFHRVHGVGAHLHYMLNRDSLSTSNLADQPTTSSSSLLKTKLLGHQASQNPLNPEMTTTPSLTPRGSPSPSQMSRTSSVKETHHISIDYDPISGRKKLNTYEIIEELGRGQHGKVKLAKDMDSGNFVAIKIVDRQGRPRLGRSRTTVTREDKIRREIAILKKCDHPNIVCLREVLDDTKSKKIYLVLEYVEKGEIRWQNDDGTPCMPRAMVRSTARDVILGLEYLHFQGIIHRDIKPANLLLSKEGKVKISDFGVSYASSIEYPNDELELAKTAGTPAFFAPELCMSTSAGENRPPITYKIDIWAFGVTLFCLLYGRVPFTADSEFELFDVIVKQDLVFPDELDDSAFEPPATPSSPPKHASIFYNLQGQDDSASSLVGSSSSLHPPTKTPQRPRPFTGERDDDLESAKDLIRKMLEKDVSKRIGIHEIKRHPWICQGMDSAHLEQFLHTGEGGERIQVTGEEVQQAVQGISGKIRRGLTRFGTTALEFAGLRRKSSNSSISSKISGTGSRSTSREPALVLSSASTSSTSKHKHHLSFGSSFSNALNASMTKSRTLSRSSAALDSSVAAAASEVRRSSVVSAASMSSSNRSWSRTMVSSQSNLNLHSLLEGDVGYEDSLSTTTNREPELSESSAPSASNNSSPIGPNSLPSVFHGWSSAPDKGKKPVTGIEESLGPHLEIPAGLDHPVLSEVASSDFAADREDSEGESSEDSEGELTLVLGPHRQFPSSSQPPDDRLHARPKMPRRNSSKKRTYTLSGDDRAQDADVEGGDKSDTLDDTSLGRYRSKSITVGILERQGI